MQPRTAMKPHFALSFLLLLPALLVFSTSACDPHTDDVVVPAPVVPTSQGAVQRSQERWAKLTQRDFVAAYDFNVPERKRHEPLGTFMGNMERHRYENPKVQEVVALKDDTAYLRISVLWTSLDERTKQVKLEPGQTLTQDIELIETWKWVDGDWWFSRPARAEEFFREHPEMLRQANEPAKEPADASQQTPPKQAAKQN